MTKVEIRDEQLHITRLTANEFKAIIVGKGWLMKDLAIRWGLTRARVSQICADEQRPIIYEDAVKALPERIKI
ncbi:MAG: hypothetical protein KDI39_09475 [Pseudomonadales bacterium]|nr:hypothetical protein [Pseudomonadales bacterium]HMX98952.1 XRE family transcriptional regulator [Agitococcus sp.]